MTDKELEQIYNEAYKAVYWTAMGLLKNEADAEDIVQDTFISLIESYDSIKDKNKITSWLKRTAANKCLDRIKLAKTDNMDDEFFDSVEAIPEDFLPDSIIESEEARRIVMDIINNKLSDDVRRTLILFYFDEMSIKEIASTLGLPQGTVASRLNFAKKTIKKEVEKYEKDNDTKLYGMAIPFLSKLFIKEAEQVILRPLPASLANLSASSEASKAGANLAKSAAKKGTDIMKTKILIGSVAAIFFVGAAAGIMISLLNKKADTEPETYTSETDLVNESAVSATGKNTGADGSGTSESDQGKAASNPGFPYDISNMSSSMLRDELFYYFDNLPQDGSTKEQLDNFMRVKPNKCNYRQEESNIKYEFYPNEKGTSMYDPEYCGTLPYDIIESVTYSGYQINDGTIKFVGVKQPVSSNNPKVIITIFAKTPESGTRIYEAIVDAISQTPAAMDPKNVYTFDSSDGNLRIYSATDDKGYYLVNCNFGLSDDNCCIMVSYEKYN